MLYIIPRTENMKLLRGISVLLVILPLGLVSGSCPPPVDSSIYRQGFDCTVKTKTVNVTSAGTDDPVHIRLYNESGAVTAWYNLDNQTRNDFERGNLDSFDVHFSGITPPLSSIGIRKEGNRTGGDWCLDYVEVYCPSVEIDMRFDHYGWLRDFAQVTLTGTHLRACPNRGLQIANGTVTCTAGDRWGSRCHYRCDSDRFQLRGPDCVYCQLNGTWTSPERSTTCHDTRSLTAEQKSDIHVAAVAGGAVAAAVVVIIVIAIVVVVIVRKKGSQDNLPLKDLGSPPAQHDPTNNEESSSANQNEYYNVALQPSNPSGPYDSLRQMGNQDHTYTQMSSEAEYTEVGTV